MPLWLWSHWVTANRKLNRQWLNLITAWFSCKLQESQEHAFPFNPNQLSSEVPEVGKWKANRNQRIFLTNVYRAELCGRSDLHSPENPMRIKKPPRRLEGKVHQQQEDCLNHLIIIYEHDICYPYRNEILQLASMLWMFWHREHTLCVWHKSVITGDVKNNVCSWLLNMSEEPIERDCYKNLPNTKYWYLSRWNRWNANRYSLYLCIYVDLVPQPCSISYYVARCFVLYQITSVFCFNLRGCIGGHMVALCDQFQCLTDIFQLQLGFDSCPSSNEPVETKLEVYAFPYFLLVLL